MSKGILQTLEAVIAILMVLTFYLIFFAPQGSLPEFETLSWRLRGFSALKSLDKSNELRQYVLANNTLMIKDKLQYLLPSNVNYEIIICDQSCQKPNIQSDRLASVNYFIAGDVDDINPKQIVLYMW